MAEKAAKRECSSPKETSTPKKAKKLNEDGGCFLKPGGDVLASLKTLEILSESAEEKKIIVHGQLEGNDAVVVLEKNPFSKDTLEELFTSSTLKFDMENNIYSSYSLQVPLHLNEIKTTVIYPATEEHLKKYRSHQSFLVEETGDDYQSITLPYIQSRTFSIQWVYNILEKKAEAERIVYEDPDPKVGFTLLPDLKWDQKRVVNLYLIAIVHQRGIKSLRDLTEEHLPLLQNILKKGKEAIRTHYQLPASKLRIYLHYQPSYYHLHVHFTNLKYRAPGCGLERAHFLSDVIQNLQSDGQYYKTRTLSFQLHEGNGLLCKFKEAGRLEFR
ncbi:m7GpppX diphosphatase [Gouania willdenowi]|uniref:m7GpppX diphosphatase n=1 Tax=Gouania willdenowi TaxID=441366 RepID=A0A8C5DDI1_GOUWI|nr:m7GpppX diphosphatase [Gouania willdenowi]XP_028315645.1 m7GpppX diphosphatase [Gouania willdenowi]